MTGNVSTTTCDYDLLVIGGGINGAGIARDAAGRGLSVALYEKEDLAQHTSSASTKLIHGGLRYLEHYDFMLVRHALQEREVLLKAAPHIIWPLRFILPHHRSLRPRWLIRLGLFLYDHIGGRKILPKSHSVDLTTHVSGQALKKEFTHGFEYSDCWVQDARLVVLNVMDAALKGCEVRVRSEVTDLVREDGFWTVHTNDNNTGETASVTARLIVNASGPWVEKTLDLDEEHDARYATRLVKGSHIVVPKLFDHPYTYIFQNADNRIIFAVPYEGDYTLLGTTDMEIDGEPDAVEIDNSEVAYICAAASEYFEKSIDPETVVWTYSGVRPLYDDASANASKVTRDYKLDLDTRKNAPILSVYGGKITTYRKLADHAMEMLSAHLSMQKGDWTESAPLPGGDIPGSDFDAYVANQKRVYPWMDADVLYDYARNYGTRLDQLLQDCASMSDLGQHFGGLLYQREVDYLVEHEWAQTAEDVLWRRSKKGLQLTDTEAEVLTGYLNKQHTESGSDAA
ncbi:MAG: glycerol-3-phosphate dehydrogenase [Gammaproteobacteria bacterium]|nr:glycerol-3-phosphate dehydrogenase [Gammaproteobacteria bacterium]